MNDSTIGNDVQDFDDTGYSAFLSSLTDDDKRPSESDEGAPEAQVETPAQTATEEGEPEASDTNDPDNQEVEVKVGEETKKATLRELKRLYGQEAALTQKSQKASEQLRAAEEQIARASTSANAMLERANARYAPFKDWGVPEWTHLAATITPDEYNALRGEAQTAKAEVDFLTTEVDGYMKEQQQQQASAYREAATACLKVLEDPQTGIEGFGPALYNEMVDYAEKNGAVNVRSIVSAPALKILHKAMLYDKAQAAAKAAEKKVQKVVEKPTRVIRPNGSRPSQDTKQSALKQMRITGGDLDSAADAFAATF